MLLLDAQWGAVIMIIVSALIGMFGISVSFEGYGFRNTGIFYGTNKTKGLVATFDAVERILFAIAGLLCVIPETRTDIIGICMMAVLVTYQIVVRIIQDKKNK